MADRTVDPMAANLAEWMAELLAVKKVGWMVDH
jgi:hypothetical protein